MLQRDTGAGARSPSRPKHDPPIVDRVLFEQQQFKVSACDDIHSTQTRRNNPGVIEHRNVAAAQILQQVAENPVLDLSGVAM